MPLSVQGLESALECGVEEVAVFAAASDAFSMKNINCSVMDSFERFKPVLAAAKDAGIRVRGYVGIILLGGCVCWAGPHNCRD